MNRQSKFFGAMSLVFMSCASVRAQSSASAQGYSDLTFTAFGANITKSLETLDFVDHSKSGTGSYNIGDLSSTAGSSDSTNLMLSALANASGDLGYAFATHIDIWTLTNTNASSSESFTVDVDTYASASSTSPNSKSMAYSSADGYFFDTSTHDLQAVYASTTGSGPVQSSWQLIVGPNYSADSLNGPAFGTTSIQKSYDAIYTVVLKPGQVDTIVQSGSSYLTASLHSNTFLAATPSPMATIPFVTGLVALAKRRRTPMS